MRSTWAPQKTALTFWAFRMQAVSQMREGLARTANILP